MVNEVRQWNGVVCWPFCWRAGQTLQFSKYLSSFAGGSERVHCQDKLSRAERQRGNHKWIKQDFMALGVYDKITMSKQYVRMWFSCIRCRGSYPQHSCSQITPQKDCDLQQIVHIFLYAWISRTRLVFTFDPLMGQQEKKIPFGEELRINISLVPAHIHLTNATLLIYCADTAVIEFPIVIKYGKLS